MKAEIREYISSYLNAEERCIEFPNKLLNCTSIVLAYPDIYENGLPNLGIQSLYREINSRVDTTASRVYLPDKPLAKLYKKFSEPLVSFDFEPVSNSDMLLFSVSFEELCLNVLEMLATANLPLLKKDRSENFPFVIGGGPYCSYNPEPLSIFFDAFAIGDGEEIIHTLIDRYNSWKQSGSPKHKFLRDISTMPGMYIPELYTFNYNESGIESLTHAQHAPARVKRNWTKDINLNPAHTIFVTNKTIYEEPAFSIEVQRGCVSQCRFCYMSYGLRKSRRLSIEKVLELIDIGKKHTKTIRLFYENVGKEYLTELFTTLEQLIDGEGLKFRLGSFRADILTEDIVRVAAKAGQTCLIVAPETASDSLRATINKPISDRVFYQAVDWCSKYRIPDFGLYLMLGLPTETNEDIIKLAEFIKGIRIRMNRSGNASGTLEAHLNTFFPKPLTPFQWAAMEHPETAIAKLNRLTKILKRDFDVTQEAITKAITGAGDSSNTDTGGILIKTIIPTAMTFTQPILARGDRRIGYVLEYLHQNGDNSVESWKDALGKFGIDWKTYFRERHTDELLPWSIIDTGIKESYLKREWSNAAKGKVTTFCKPSCRECGICE